MRRVLCFRGYIMAPLPPLKSVMLTNVSLPREEGRSMVCIPR